MKTVFIYDTKVEPICFIVKDGDYRHLDRAYINQSVDSEDEENHIVELSDLIYDDEGNQLYEISTDFPVQDVIDGAFVIVVGFLP